MTIKSETVKNGSADRNLTVELLKVAGKFIVKTAFGSLALDSAKDADDVFAETVSDLASGAWSSVSVR